MVWCKHGFQQRKSNFDGKCVHFKGYGAKKLSKEILNKGWGKRGLNKLFILKSCKKPARRQDEAAALRLESLQNLSCKEYVIRLQIFSAAI